LLKPWQRHIPESVMKPARLVELVPECAGTERDSAAAELDRDQLVTKLLRHAYDLRGLVAERNQLLVHLSDSYHEALFQLACAMQPEDAAERRPVGTLTAPVVMDALRRDAPLRGDPRAVAALVDLLSKVAALCEQAGHGHVEIDVAPDLTTH
jgi:hypothetical protein